MFKKILFVLVAVLGALAGVINAQPADFTVTREIVIAAPASVIYPHVNTTRAWEAWSPWAKIDPNGKFSYEGPEAGVGAITRWAGNMELGVGSSTITENHTNERVQFRLDFEKPLKGTSTAEFTFTPAEHGGTRVSWTMHGTNNFIGKAVGLVIDCETMMNAMFDKGLANLKAVAEAEHAAAPPVAATSEEHPQDGPAELLQPQPTEPELMEDAS